MSTRRAPLVGTIATYGPDATRATKLVASVFSRPAQGELVASRTWLAGPDHDVRRDPAIAAEVAAWFARHRVKQTVTHDRMLGCPHQEGIDYPMGRTCPQCPFWAGIDRFTHEPIAPPTATLTADEVLAELAVERHVLPPGVLDSADAHREALVGPLLRALEAGIADPEATPEPQALLFSYALYLLAKWRETRAYPLVVRWLALPDEGAFAIAGDIVTQDGDRILAGVCDGSLAPIRALILDRALDEFSRGVGISALARLAAWGEVPRETVVAELLWLAQEGLEREPSAVWDALASACADIEALEVFPELRRAYVDGRIDPISIGEDELDEVEAGPRGSWIEADRDRHPPIDDVARATSWWARFDRPIASDGDDEDEDDTPFESDGPIEPYRAPPKVGRNEPCPCGSGKKYKKCCGR